MNKLKVILFMFSPLIFNSFVVLVLTLIDPSAFFDFLPGIYVGAIINILLLLVLLIIFLKSGKYRKAFKSGKRELAVIQSVARTSLDNSQFAATLQLAVFSKNGQLQSSHSQLKIYLPIKQLENCQPGYFLSVIYLPENFDCFQDLKPEDSTTEKNLDAYQAARYPENLSSMELQKLRTRGINQLVLIKDIQIISQVEQDVKLALTIQLNNPEETVKREFVCPKELCSQLIVGKMIDIRMLRDEENLFALEFPNRVLTNPEVIQFI